MLRGLLFQGFDYCLVLYIKIVQMRFIPQLIYNIRRLRSYLVLYIKMRPFAWITAFLRLCLHFQMSVKDYLA
jgi:hypothetical protein